MKMPRSKSLHIDGRSGIFMGNPIKSISRLDYSNLITLLGLRPAAVATLVGIGNNLTIS